MSTMTIGGTQVEASGKALISEALGPLVPVMTNSPGQWIAAAGMMLRVRAGSEVSGMSLGGSDIDEIGVCVEPHQTVIGGQTFKHYQYRTAADGETSGPGDMDLIVYGLRKYAHLVAEGNPTVLATLFTPPEHVLYGTGFADELFERRDMFLSRKAGPKFRGYLESQRRGLMGLRSGGSRNQGRADIRERLGFDGKFAAHMLRLGYQGVELLTTGTMTLPIPEPHRSRLLALRRGGWPLEEAPDRLRDALDEAERLERQIERLMEDSRALPEQPDHGRINEWLADVHRRHWGWTLPTPPS